MKMNIPLGVVMGLNENANSKFKSFFLTAWKEKRYRDNRIELKIKPEIDCPDQTMLLKLSVQSYS